MGSERVFMAQWRQAARRRRAAVAAARARAERASRAEADVDGILRRTGLCRGARVLAGSDCHGCHLEALRARGLRVDSFHPIPGEETEFRLAPEAAALARGADGGYDGCLVFGGTLLSYWEVEEIHRMRLSRLRRRLRDGGWLCFGDPGALSDSRAERARLARAADAAGGAPGRGLALTDRFTHYTAAQARTLLEACGFTVEGLANGPDTEKPYAYDGPGLFLFCRSRTAAEAPR